LLLTIRAFFERHFRLSQRTVFFGDEKEVSGEKDLPYTKRGCDPKWEGSL